MQKDESEEKSLPASPKKLRDARKKGQISHSKDAVIATTLIVALVYLWLAAPLLLDRLEALMVLPADAHGRAFGEVAGEVAGEALLLAVAMVGPLFAAVVAVSILTNLAVLRGFLFALKPITPNLDHVNPVEGFKRIFALKNWIELAKSTVKVLLIGAALLLCVLIGLDLLMKAPGCGEGCIAWALVTLVQPMIAAAAIIFLLAALIDVGLQRWLFLRDMRMTKTEFKRERKDMEGDPTIRGVRRRQRRDLAQSQTRLGVRHASVVIADGGDHAVGVRFVRGETPAPVVVCRGDDARARGILEAAHHNGTKVYDDRELAQALTARGSVGEFVPEDLFTPVAVVLMRVGAV